MERLFGTIPAVLRSLEPNPLVTEAIVFAGWKQAVGEGIALRSMPTSFSGTRLVVAVGDETWQRHLEALSPQIVSRMNELLGHGSVTFIEFRVDPHVEYGR